MGAMASQITSLAIVYSTVYSDADQRKHQSSAALAFMRGIHRWSVNSSHKWPVMRKMFPFDDVIMAIIFQGFSLPQYCRCLVIYTQIHIYPCPLADGILNTTHQKIPCIVHSQVPVEFTNYFSLTYIESPFRVFPFIEAKKQKVHIFKHPISWFRDFERSLDKTSYRYCNGSRILHMFRTIT